jgi:hypothetical protein
MFRFTIRDVLWLTLLVAIAVVCGLEKHRAAENTRAWDSEKLRLQEQVEQERRKRVIAQEIFKARIAKLKKGRDQ